MKITECLGIEHRIFLRQVDRLEETLHQGDAQEQCKAMVRLLAEVLDEHAQIEDDLLFPELEPHLGRQAGPLAVMDMEHREIRRLLSEMADPAGDTDYLVAQFIGIVRDHFAKEDQVLFPLAEQVIERSRLEELGHSCPHVQPLTRG